MDQVYQVGNVANVEGHFTGFSTHTKQIVPVLLQSNSWDLSVISRPLFTKVPGFNAVLEEIIFVSRSNVTAGTDPEHFTIIDDYDGVNVRENWVDLSLNQVGSVARIVFGGGVNGRIVRGNLTVTDSTGAGVAAGIVDVFVVGFLVAEF